MKRFLPLILFFSSCQPSFATFIRLESDAFDKENADQTAFIINSNLVNFWSTKLDSEIPPETGPQRFVYDLLNPDNEVDNEIAINQDIDDIWRAKKDANGIQDNGGRAYVVEGLPDPDKAEENILILNQLFQDLDTSKAESQ